ncbi:MAG: mannose-6-phosphate isomerase, partial [Paludibacteraceae bacterium]|nr:mannose-6-phosphate isomerase [Paludibacteraceae bacterium]
YTVYKEYRNTYKDTIDTANACLDTEHFSVRVVSLQNPIHRNMVNYDSFVIITCMQGACSIRIRSTKDEVVLHEGFSCLIPAAIADYDILPQNKEAKLLESYINNKPQNSLRRMISQFLHLSGV